MIQRIISFLAIFLSLNTAFAQTPPTNLEGSELRAWLKQNWYDNAHNELGYNEARRKMYGYIDNHNDTITCVYSGYRRINPYGNEITFPNPINTEHTVPQSFFGSAEPMRSDIHAIFPTYINWNSERGSSPFIEIPDPNTTRWMRGASAQFGIPTAFIDEYSESISGQYFEPREDHKGNVARAVFYFYTMYPQVGSIQDVAAIVTLCNWHNEDPVDAAEIARNDGAALYQGNRNPYIDLPELTEKAWGCTATTNTVPEDNAVEWGVFPNPFSGRFTLRFSSDSNEKISLYLYDLNGKLLEQVPEKIASDGIFELEFDQPLADGIFILQLRQGERIYHKKIVSSR